MRHIRALCLLSLTSAANVPAFADQTVGLFINEPEAAPGYTLFSPLGYDETFLIDVNGQLVHSWPPDGGSSFSVYLLESGNLLRLAGSAVNELDWDGTRLWTFRYGNMDTRAHHDIEPMPNGNVLILAWETKTAAEAIAAGRDPQQISDGELQPEHIVEVRPEGKDGGTIVWEWHVWDHLVQDFDPAQENFGVVADHPELIDINFQRGPGADWLHANAIDYNANLDQIVINSPNLGEFWIIDHSTTTAEAAGHTGGTCGRGGDFLYRWGNPQAYDAGTDDDRKFYFQHDVRWLDDGLPGAGNILVFNNGQDRPEGPFSSIEEVVTPVTEDGCYVHVPGTAYGPDDPTWIYTADPPTDFYSSFISGATRQPNGNTLICSGAWGEIFEVTSGSETVWRYVSPVTSDGPLTQGDEIPQQGNSTDNRMFRAGRYPPDYPGFAGRDLSPRGTIEIVSCPGDVDVNDVVDFADLLALLSAWGGWSYADLDGNGVVDFSDLLLLLTAWGECP